MLASVPEEIPEQAMALIERFVVLLYNRTSSQTTVNEARQELLSKGNRTLENIPPTQAALLQHTRRAVYQAGHIWGNALVPKPTLPSPSDWGWEKDENRWKPVWTLLPQAQQICYKPFLLIRRPFLIPLFLIAITGCSEEHPIISLNIN